MKKGVCAPKLAKSNVSSCSVGLIRQLTSTQRILLAANSPDPGRRNLFPAPSGGRGCPEPGGRGGEGPGPGDYRAERSHNPPPTYKFGLPGVRRRRLPWGAGGPLPARQPGLAAPQAGRRPRRAPARLLLHGAAALAPAARRARRELERLSPTRGRQGRRRAKAAALIPAAASSERSTPPPRAPQE